MFVSVLVLVVVFSILARLLTGSPGVKVCSVLLHASATATRYYDLIRDVMSIDCIYYGTGTSTSVGCPDHLGHFFCLVYVGCGGQLGHFFLFDLQASWDISSNGCLDQLGYYLY